MLALSDFDSISPEDRELILAGAQRWLNPADLPDIYPNDPETPSPELPDTDAE